MAEYLKKKGKNFPFTKNISSVNGILKKCNAEYLTEGLTSLRKIPENSIDLIWSEAVFEHIQLYDFDTIIVELKRILKPGGIITAQVGCMSKKPRQVKNWLELLKNNFGNVTLDEIFIPSFDCRWNFASSSNKN